MSCVDHVSIVVQATCSGNAGSSSLIGDFTNLPSGVEVWLTLPMVTSVKLNQVMSRLESLMDENDIRVGVAI